MASHTLKFLVIHIFQIFLIFHASYGRNVEREMTVEVKAGTEECFYETVKAGETLDVEYQIIDGGQGDLNINFYMTGQTGEIILQDMMRSEGNHRITITHEDDYRICWDNTFSHFSTKTVFFGITIENDDDDDDLWDEGMEDTITGEEIYEMKIEDIKDAMGRIRAHLTKSRFMQDQLRAYEARDRNLAESNCSKVTSWSMVNISVMLVTGLIQVILLRSLFDEKSRLHGIWKKGASSTFS